MHKVHAKKIEHHHEEHEEKLPKWKPKRDQGRKHKAHGSYSHVQPVLLDHDSQEQIEHPAEHRQGLKYGPGQEYGRGRDYHGHDYSQEGDWSLESNSEERRARPIDDGSREERHKWEPVDLGGWFGRGRGEDNSDEWLISSEDLRELKEDYGFLGGKGGSYNGQKRKKDKPLSLPKKPTVIDMEKDGWKPLMDFRGWKDVGQLQNNGQRGYSRDPFDYSGEDESEWSSEESTRGGREFSENIQNKEKKPRKNSKKSGKWSKQIEVREPTSEEDPQLRQRPTHTYNNPPVPQMSYAQRPSDHTHSQSQLQQKPWQTQERPQKRWPEPLPLPQAQQWPHPQPTPTLLSTPPPQSQPSSVVWSGHHLQTPQHTMWHVQQHNVQTPVQVPVSSNPPPVVPVHSPPLLPLRQLQPQQTQQASVPAHRVAAPAWPPSQKTPGVMQQWEQTVHMGDGVGPGSSYKVEVINYSGH